MSDHPTVFISYSHDSDEHKNWIRGLAEKLISNGVDVILDQWDLFPSNDLAHFMKSSMSRADRVIVVCTKNYVEKCKTPSGGVGYEQLILNAVLFNDILTDKFIPIICSPKHPDTVPAQLGSRVYIDFTNDDVFKKKFDELLREIHKQPALKKPELGKNPFLPEPEIELSTITFDKRFSDAFPGVRGKQVFEGEQAISRLKILLKKPLGKQGYHSIWWWGHGDLHISSFEAMDSDSFLMNIEEYSIRKIVAVNPGVYYQKFVYVETNPLPPTGIYEYSINDFESSEVIKEYGRIWEEYAFYNGYMVSREEWDDGAAVINDEPTSLDGSAELRVRYLTRNNFVIAADKHPINNKKFDQRRREILDEILLGASTVDDLVEELLALPKLY